MRTLVRGSVLIILAGVMGGCSSGMGAKSEAPPAATVAEASTCVLKSGGENVLRLTTPANSKCVSKDGSLVLTTPEFELDVWLVPGAQTIDEAMGSVGKQIESQFKDFKADSTTDLTIAGAPAKRLAGTGHEADDGDNGQADLIVFTVGNHVFVALTHDESLPPTARTRMLATVQTATAP